MGDQEGKRSAAPGEQASELLAPVFEELLRQTAAGEVLYDDDTTVQVRELASKASAVDAEDAKSRERKWFFTTGIVSETGEQGDPELGTSRGSRTQSGAGRAAAPGRMNSQTQAATTLTTTGTDRNRPPVRHRRRRAAQLFSLILFGTVSAGGAAHLWLPDVPAGIPVDTVALDVTPALTLAAVSNVAAFTSP